MGDAIVKQGGADLDALFRTAQALSRAGSMLPRNLRDPGEILAVIMSGQELGLGPMASLRGLYLIHGKVGMDYATMIGLLRRHGYRIEWVEKSDTVAHLRLTHPDGSTHEEVWDVKRAKAAKLWGNKGPWSQYPEAMLTARCVSSAARAFAGDVLAGCYSMDEAREIAGNTPTVTVEAEPDPHSYDNPDLAREAAEAVSRAEAWVAERIAEMKGNVDELRAFLAEGGDAQVAADQTRDELEKWFATHIDDLIDVFRHPKAHSRRGNVLRAAKRWASIAGLAESLVNDLHKAAQDGALAAREAGGAEAAE